MTAHVILNPAARNGRAARLGPAVLAALASEGVEARLHPTAAPGEATRTARALAAGGHTVLAAGGDGTVHEVASGMVGTEGVLGVLPLGTGNDFALALGMARGLAEAARQIARTPPRRIDAGRVAWTDDLGEHTGHFANGLGAGFGAHAAALASRSKWLGGHASYVAAVLRTLWRWRRPALSVRVEEPDGGEVRHAGPLFLCEVGNGHSVGGGFLLTPEARPDDGLLDVCLVRHLPTRRALRLLPRTFSGTHVGAPEVTMGRVRGLRLTATEGTFGLHADGEILSAAARSVAVDVWPGALRVIAPRLAADEG